jgi:cation channel sperm-associated protein 3
MMFFSQVDGWTDIQDRLDHLGYVVGGRIYTIVFIILGHFIFTNVFIGVIIMNISEAAEAFKVLGATVMIPNRV